MATKAEEIQLNITDENGKFIDAVKVDAHDTVEKLKRAVFNGKSGMQPNRQQLALPKGDNQSVVLENRKRLSFYELEDEDILVVKDLGPQLSWRTVFILEYLGPLIIHQIFFFWRLNTTTLTTTQILAWACITFHFAKREFESIFIHRFSNVTRPVSQLFINSSHYWLMAGVLIGHYLYAPGFKSPSTTVVISSLIVFLAAELGNLYSHVALRNLRPEGSTTRVIPRGGFFELVSCPNYTFEILAWTAMSVMTGLISMWIFTITGSVVMCGKALKNHQRYHKEFSTYPKSRKAIIPFVL
ncbi:Glycoprotein, synaptic 2 family protein [Paramicrosporidium saccamoebae]|uniref:Glycoprotein, synaptic 2 family protein n=1 Tax=Paramicrosporidium saccamoebae TaxID=1246581 RepID=A0A2H9TJ47_9FUNG|nr:Glycoprotein, synaptic 2 family protein [Paramicrosporidium saccamoebae]